jgi:hypothetical protein
LRLGGRTAVRIPRRALRRVSQQTKGVESMGPRHRLAAGGVLATAALFVCLTVSPALAGPPDHASVSGSITPIVECTTKHNGVNHSVFGYRNTGATTVISVGTGNQFTPGAPDRGQPTTFLTGTHINVFSATTSASLTWTLDGQVVRSPGITCQTDSASSTLAGWGPIGALVIVTGFLGSLLFWRTRRLKVRTR